MDEVNPYAAPLQTAPPLNPEGEEGQPREWQPVELLSEAWGVFKLDWPVLLGAILTTWVLAFAGGMVGAIGQGVLRVVFGVADSSPLNVVFALASFVLQMSLSIVSQLGMQSVALASARGESPSLGVFLDRAPRLFPYFGAFMLVGFAILGGLLLLIIPAFVIAMGLCVATYYAGDQNVGAMDALRMSWQATQGQKIKIFGFFILIGFLNLAGMVPCFTGLIITMPMTAVAMALLYIRVSGYTSAAPMS